MTSSARSPATTPCWSSPGTHRRRRHSPARCCTNLQDRNQLVTRDDLTTMTERIVLAYSGGLDTSVAIGWIAERPARRSSPSRSTSARAARTWTIRKRALDCGAVEAVVADARDEFAERVLPARAAGQRALHGPLPAGLRAVPPVIVKHLVAAAKTARHRRARLHRQGQRPGAVRGGSGALAPELTSGAGPRLRAWTREKAIAVRRGPRAADRREQEGRTPSTRTSGAARSRPGSSRTSGTARSRTSTPTSDPAEPREPDEVVDHASSRRPVAIDGAPVTTLAGDPGAQPARRRQGVGRLDMVEDRLVGIKSREVYEAPARSR